MCNNYLKFYGENHISPVRQDINDLKVHYLRREKLYRQCGIPVMAFRDKEILEIGPGGGYNSLAFFHWGSRHIDLVEPNAKGREDMLTLFGEKGVLQERFRIYSSTIEDFEPVQKYDIIIAEGFLYAVDNKKEIIDKCKSLLANNGIIVITCSDHMCCFIEAMKRLIGHALVKNIEDYNDKVDCLVKIFEPQLLNLRGMSRSAKDWVQDQLLNPAFCKMELSISEAIDFFGEEYDILGTSPNMFTDYSWYKDIWYDYRVDYKKQFAAKRASLLMAGMPEKVLQIGQTEEMAAGFDKISYLASQYESVLDEQYIVAIKQCLSGMKDKILPLGEEFGKVYSEIEEALAEILKEGTVDMGKYPNFFAAFGRTQQYIAIVKKSY